MNPRPARLPEGFAREVRGPSYCLRALELDSFLAEQGYTLAGEVHTRRSSLTGRKPLEELDTPHGVLVLRRFTHGGWLRALSGRRFLDPLRPLRELELCEALRARGIGVPRIVGARARRLFPLGFALDLLSVRIPAARDLDALRVDPSVPLRPLARELGAFVRRMHAAGLYHADLTTKNLLATSQGLVAIDLDRSRLEPAALGPADRVRNLERLARFVLRREQREGGRLSLRDQLAFLRAYEPERRARRELFRALRARRGRSLWWHRLGWWLERRVAAPR